MRSCKAPNSGLVVPFPPSLKYMCKSVLLTYRAKALQNKSVDKFKSSILIRKSTNDIALFLSHFFPPLTFHSGFLVGFKLSLHLVLQMFWQ